MKSENTNNFGGYVAIVSMLVVLAVVVIIGTAVSYLSINDMQSALSARKSQEVFNLADSCVEDALYKLGRDGMIPSAISLPEGDCSVTINLNDGQLWDFTVEAANGGYVKRINVNAERDTGVLITRYREIE